MAMAKILDMSSVLDTAHTLVGLYSEVDILHETRSENNSSHLRKNWWGDGRPRSVRQAEKTGAKGLKLLQF